MATKRDLTKYRVLVFYHDNPMSLSEYKKEVFFGRDLPKYKRRHKLAWVRRDDGHVCDLIKCVLRLCNDKDSNKTFCYSLQTVDKNNPLKTELLDCYKQ